MAASQAQPHHLPTTNLPFTPSSQQPIKSEFGSDLTLSPSSIPQNLTMQQQLMNHNSPIQLHGFPTKLSTQMTPSTLSISTIAATSLSSASVSAATPSGSMSSAAIAPSNRTENNENNPHLRHQFQKEINQSSSSANETAKRSE